MAITGWGNFRPLSALSVDAGPTPLRPACEKTGKPPLKRRAGALFAVSAFRGGAHKKPRHRGAGLSDDVHRGGLAGRFTTSVLV